MNEEPTHGSSTNTRRSADTAEEKRWDDAKELAEALQEMALTRGGFPPTTLGSAALAKSGIGLLRHSPAWPPFPKWRTSRSHVAGDAGTKTREELTMEVAGCGHHSPSWQDGDLNRNSGPGCCSRVSQGGTPPETSVETPYGMGDPWDKAVTEAVCKLVLSTKAKMAILQFPDQTWFTGCYTVS
ncbi:MAG: hypothetical protein U0936_28040 [Planctomycetaceae bacterium]